SDHMSGDTEPQTDRVAETEKAETAITEPRGHEQATVIRRPLFIPDAPRDVGLDEELVETAPVPQEAPRTSLINRISGLWSGKTDSASAASADSASAKEEPQLNRSDVTLPSIEEPAIMDLPKADMVQTSLPVDPVTKEEEAEDDDLDIPAFLRRQAN
ncbi:MAG: cell division protein FtsZ, partial [Pseudomonadota bacterium]|nr:cell division protein FtsZ [Pseudomonadota bacterium]